MTEEDIEGLIAQIEFLTKLITTRFARSSPIEEKLLGIASGKLPLPTREQCGEWGEKLGVPDEFHAATIKTPTAGTGCPSHA